MKCQGKIISFILVSLIISFSLLTPIKLLAIGQMTKPIMINNAMRGQEIEQTITINNSEDKIATGELIAEGEIEPWTTFYEVDQLDKAITNITLPASSNKQYIAKINIPADLPNGEYNGLISVLKQPEQSTATTTLATITQKVSRQVTIAVTDQEDINFKAIIIPEKYDLLPGELFKLRLQYQNQGNTLIKPQVQVKIKQDPEIHFNAIIPYPENEPGVKPLKTYEITPIEVPVNGLKPGIARAEITILYNDEIIQEETIKITYDNKAEQEIESEAKPVKSDLIIFILILVVIIIIGIVLKILKKRSA